MSSDRSSYPLKTLPPAEANIGKGKVSGDTPDPGRRASPPAPPVPRGCRHETLDNRLICNYTSICNYISYRWTKEKGKVSTDPDNFKVVLNGTHAYIRHSDRVVAESRTADKVMAKMQQR